ncbi:DUF2953 domain-containing protein [Caloramator sp. CAR-1]|uniref:DUF2953 domain-containing protein n=1 Tax=Caloramator sp. CAR-1 TaxID=3062777 RepID=UPI0026E198D4|nr:DUF2953 domain-containing protein [Caloramator sp. CAR-1]MDO6354504.1 DUF2953 domain-containing protein [Caloramator sp. CAR-1]
MKFFLLLLIFFIIVVIFSKTYIEIYFDLNKLNIKLNFLYVIKIKLFEKNIKEKNKTKSIRKERTRGNIEILELVRALISNILHRLDVNLDIDFLFGTKEPHITAILYGMMNSFLGSLYPILKDTFKNYNQKINITPVFDKELYDLKLDILIKIQNLYLIWMSIIFLSKYIKKKGKGGFRYGTSNRSINENYNG